MSDDNKLQEEILTFWFGERTGPFDMGPNQRMWWVKDPELDKTITERYGSHLERAAAGDYDGWLASPRSALALVILLDQFSRNIHRGSAKTWENDDKAVACTQAALDAGHHEELEPVERQFLYMPLMHSEDIAQHDKSMSLIQQTFDAIPEDKRGPFESWVDFGKQHQNIVKRFGRYPHRNAILGRSSTDEEIAFLKEPGSSF